MSAKVPFFKAKMALKIQFFEAFRKYPRIFLLKRSLKKNTKIKISTPDNTTIITRSSMGQSIVPASKSLTATEYVLAKTYTK